MKSQLTDQDRDDIRHILQQSVSGEARTLDFTDQREERFYRRQLELAGIEHKHFPQTHKTVDLALAAGGPRTPAQVAAGSGSPVDAISQIASGDNGQTYETTALSSIPGGTYNTTITLGLYDANYNPIGNVEKGHQFNDGRGFSLSATGSFDTPIPETGRQVYSIATVQYTTSQGTTHQNIVASTFNFPSEINNIDPRDVNNSGIIKVCLTRNDGDCDYLKNWQGDVEIPIKGSIVYFGDIDLDDSGKPVNATNIIKIARTDEGGDPLTPPAGFNFFDDPKTIVNGATLSWDLSWMTFGTPDFDSGDEVYYIFSVKVQVGGEDVTAFITNAPSSVQPGQTGLNTLKLPEMHVVYGCLAGESMVTMADNSKKTIAGIQVGDKVISDADGTVLTVENTVEGTEERPMICIKDEQGHKLLVSDGHPVLTLRGMKLAKELTVNDMVQTLSGWTAIESLEKKSYDKTVCNLHLGIPEDGVQLTHDNRTHFAEGILVGDGRTQRYYGRLFKERKEEVLLAIPEEWHQDYLSSLK